MKKNQTVNLESLCVDAVEFLFVRWLDRQNAYSAFKANCYRVKPNSETFRDYLRAKIRYVLRNSVLDVGDLPFTCFLFASTPEGLNHWAKLFVAWRGFVNSCRKNL